MGPLQPDDNVVDMPFAFDAAMQRMVRMQENIVLLEAQVAYLKLRLRESEREVSAREHPDEGGVVFSD